MLEHLVDATDEHNILTFLNIKFWLLWAMFSGLLLPWLADLFEQTIGVMFHRMFWLNG